MVVIKFFWQRTVSSSSSSRGLGFFFFITNGSMLLNSFIFLVSDEIFVGMAYGQTIFTG